MEQIIKRCSRNPFDDIWISGEEEYPSLAILVNEDLACVHYFTLDGDDYQSAGNEESDGTTEFNAGGQITEMPNYTVVPLSLAIECAKQFFKFQDRPSCIISNEI
ncbi:MAG TPA: Imm1 family immunity protein [Clostridia bacterium]